MKLDDVATQLHLATAPIWTEHKDRGEVLSSGLIYSKQLDDGTSIPLLIVNKHVVQHVDALAIALNVGMSRSNQNIERKLFRIREDFFIHIDHESLDIAIIPLGPVIHKFQEQETELQYRSVTRDFIPTGQHIESFSALERILVVGHPDGFYRRKSNPAIFRQGITATPYWEEIDGQPLFMIDTGGSPPSQGSSIYVYERGMQSANGENVFSDRVLFLGMIAKPPHIDSSRSGLEVGVAVKSTAIEYFVESALENMK